MITCEKCRYYSVPTGKGKAVFEWCLKNSIGNGQHGTAWGARMGENKCGPGGKWFEPKPRQWWRL